MIQAGVASKTMPQVVVRTADYIEQKTRAYWLLSNAAKGRGESMTTGDAIDYCRELSKVVGPSRPLHVSISKLTKHIIFGPETGIRRKKTKKNNVCKLFG